jgi:tryptophan 2,3-dioxygenase
MTGTKLENKSMQSGHTPLSYNTYLKVSELKKLQECQSDPAHHDEPLFIVIHQAYELWFKLILHELDTVTQFIVDNDPRQATFFMRRIIAILKLLVGQIHLLETMSPKDFLGFRYALNPASGFQSSQFREIEISGGIRDEQLLEHFKSDPDTFAQLQARLAKPSLQELFYDLLRRQGFKLDKDQSEEARLKELTKLFADDKKMYDLKDLSETFVDFDEQLSLWRINHVTVVERMIGFKRGTGGSEGVGYLRTTLTKRCFPDLWNMRSYLE